MKGVDLRRIPPRLIQNGLLLSVPVKPGEAVAAGPAETFLNCIGGDIMLLSYLLIPFLGTSLGAACVFALRDRIPPKLNKLLIGFASGVMVAASVWSLLIPAMELSADLGRLSFLPSAVGLFVGMSFLLLLDELIPHLHLDTDVPEGPRSGLGKSAMMVLAVTLHNIPEGMAVGVACAGVLSGQGRISASAALVLAIGIAVQNFPEGAIISMPLVQAGLSKRRAFLCGVASGAVEPLGALLMIALTRLLSPLLPYFLAFAAGAMLYVVVEELIPEGAAGEHSNIATVGFFAGFVLMMILDVALG